MKTHFAVKVAFSTESVASCGRNGRMSPDVYRVDCLLCKNRHAYILAKDEADSARHIAFMAQAPRRHSAQFGGPVVCSECEGDQFRIGNRTCYGHYENFHCANCGHVESRLTETGMSF